MQKRNPIVNLPLLIGSVLSVAIHVGALYGKGLYTPPKPMTTLGRTVVRLTLMPSVASQAAAAEPPAEQPADERVELQVEQASLPALLSEPVPPPEATQASSLKSQVSAPSPEQDSTLVEEKGVTAMAETFKAILPTYPRISKHRGEEGTVTLSIEVLANGSAGQVSIIKSSGHRRLDKAAVKAGQATTFTPARQLGRNIDSTTELSFTFRLTDD